MLLLAWSGAHPSGRRSCGARLPAPCRWLKLKAGSPNGSILMKGKGANPTLAFPLTDATAVTVQMVRNPGSTAAARIRRPDPTQSVPSAVGR